MMGSSTALPQAPVEKTVFVEDMTDQQLAKTVSSPTDSLQYMFVKFCLSNMDGFVFMNSLNLTTMSVGFMNKLVLCI